MKGRGLIAHLLRALAAVALAIAGAFLFASSAGAQDETLRLNSVTISGDGQGTATLSVEDIGAPGLGSWTIDVIYDSSVATAVQCTAVDGVCNAGFAPNTVRFVAARSTGIQGDATLGSISFTCDQDGATSLTLVATDFHDATTGAPQPIDPKLVHGSVFCTGGQQQDVPGDVDCNGIANSVDAALILQLTAGLIASLPCQDNADVDCDTTIGSIDAALILQFSAGLISSLEC